MTEALTEQQPTTTNTTTNTTTTRIDGDDHEESTVSLMDQLLTQHSTVILFACHFNTTCIENSVDIDQQQQEQQEQQHDSEVTWMTIQTRDGSKLDQCTVRVASTSTTEASSSSSSSNEQQQQQQQDENESSVIVVTSLSQVMQKFDQYLYEKYIRDKSEFCLVLYDSAEQLYSKHGLYHMAESLGIRLAAHYQSFYDLKNILVLNNNNNSSSNDDDNSDVNNNNNNNSNNSSNDDKKLNDTISKCKQMQQVFISKHNQIVQHSQEKIKNFKLSVESPEWTGRIASTTKPISTPVIRLRGLPWTCSEEDIAEFFAGRKLASKSLNPSFASSYAASLNEKELQESEQQEQPQEEGEEEKLENEQESVSGENKQQQEEEEAIERHETVDNENNQEEQVVDLIEAKDASDANVLLVLNSYGRATGEAYVEFVSVAEAKLAFDKDRATMKHRYIEIFASSKHEMEQVRCGIEHDLGALGDSTVIRMRGLPYKANVSHIEQFFDGLEIGTFPRRSRSQPNGQVVYHKKILIVIGQDGKSTGDAYVEFVDVAVLKEALKRNKEKIFNRYIELFRSTIAEMNAARLYSKRYSYQYQIQQQQQQQPGMEYAPVYNGYPPHPQQPYRRYPRQHHNNGNYQPEYMGHQMGYYENDNNNNEVNEMDEQQQHDEQLVVSDYVVRLTNLSIQFDEKYIAELFSILGIEIVPQGIHLVIDDNEVSTGEAFVELYSEDDVDTAVLSLTETLKADGAQVTKSSAQELVSPSNSLSPEETGETYDSSLESEHQQQQEEHIVEEEVQSDVQYREYSQQQSQGYHNHHPQHQQHHHYQNRQQHHYPQQQQQQQQHKPHYHYSNYHQRSNYNHHNHHHNGNYHYHNNNRSQQYHHHYNNANHYHQHQYAGIPQYQQEQEMNGYNQQPQNAYVEQLDYSSGGMQPQQQYHHYKPRRGNYRGGGAQRHTTQRHNNNYQGTYYHSHQQPYHPTASEHETNTSPE